MRVGSLIYATDSGLGVLAKSFVDAGVITHPLVIRHGRHPEHDEWYPGVKRIGDLRGQIREIEEHCRSVDVMLFLETPFEYSLISHCRQHGVKTAICVMHECFHERGFLPENRCDLYLCPSMLDLQQIVRSRVFFREWRMANGSMAKLVPVPVDGVKWRQRTEAKVFVHNAGHGGLKGRNGTKELLQAIRHVKTPAKFVIRSQEKIDVGGMVGASPNEGEWSLQWEFGTAPQEVLYAEGDVFIFPEAFNGLSLPLQEARAAGMLVMCGDRFPMNEWLPREPLIPVANYTRERVGPPYIEYERANFDPKAIAATIDAWYGRDISDYSKAGRAWAETMSWAALKPRYMEVLAS